MLPTPATVGSGEEMFFLDRQDRSLLRELILRERLRREIGNEEVHVPDLQAPEVLIVKIPDDGIPAAEFKDEKLVPGKAECELYKIVPKDEREPFGEGEEKESELKEVQPEGASIKKEWIFNIYPVKWYKMTTSGKKLYAVARRDRFGRWLIEKPTYHQKVKPKEDVEPGTEVECEVILHTGPTPPEEEEETIMVRLDHMAGNQPIRANDEASAVYRENQGYWEFDGHGCNEAAP